MINIGYSSNCETPCDLSHFLDRAAALDPSDYAGLRQILLEAEDAALTEFDLQVVSAACGEALGLDAVTMRIARRDIRATHSRHGYLRDKDAVVQALKAELEQAPNGVITSKGSVWTYIADPADEQEGMWQRVPEETLDHMVLREFPLHANTRSARAELLQRFRIATRATEPDPFDRAPAGICLMNGFLRYVPESDDFELAPHSGDNFVRNKLQVDYDAAASAPEFEQCLLRAVGGDPVKVQAYLEFVSCAVFGQKPDADRMRTCLVLLGPPRCGKSTLIDLAKLFFIEEQVGSLSPEFWADPQHVVQLAPIQLNVLTEMDARRKLRGHALKKVLSHEPVTGRYMRQNSFSFTPTCMNLWATNDLIRIDEKNDSILRRFMVINMGETLSDEEAANSLWDVVEREAAGVINLLARSFLDVQRRGRFVLPADSDLLVSRMQFGDDLAALYVRRFVTHRSGSRLKSADLMADLRTFAAELGLDPEDVDYGTMRQASDAMKELGATRRKNNGKPFYEHVAVQGRPAPASGPESTDAEGRAFRDVLLDDL